MRPGYFRIGSPVPGIVSETGLPEPYSVLRYGSGHHEGQAPAPTGLLARP